jgi:hypothetical protein
MTMNPKKRCGNFTSSEIAALMCNGKAKGSLGKPALTYIAEKNLERRLGRPINSDTNAKPTSWGSLCEEYVLKKLLGTEYRLCSKQTLNHPTVKCWVGSPDAEKFDDGKTVADVKAPKTLKSFCSLVQPYYDGLRGMDWMNALRFGYINKMNGQFIDKHDDGDTFFYQIVSNACITGAKYGEIIIYAPYKSELNAIRELAHSYDGPNQNKFSWIAWASDDELPWLFDGGYYRNINVLRFEIPVDCKIALHQRVIEASEYLIDVAQPLTVAV